MARPTMLDRLGFGLDRAISVVAPEAGLRRVASRHAGIVVRETYAAAKTPRTSAGWHPTPTTDVNDVIQLSTPAIRGRIQQLVRDFPPFFRAVNALEQLTIGTGIQFQSRVRDEVTDDLDLAACRQIQDYWSRWSEQADVAGELHFEELQGLARRQDVELGEFMALYHWDDTPGRVCPVAMELRETTWLTEHNAIPVVPGNALRQGIEFNINTGARQFYHLQDPRPSMIMVGGPIPVQPFKVIAVPRSEVQHRYQVLRPGQLRGVSPFAAAIMMAHDLNDYVDAEMDAAKMAAKWLGFVTTADPSQWQRLRSEPGKFGQKIERMENAMLEYLRPGESVSFASSNRPNGNLAPFARFVLQMVAITVDVPYELLSGDYSGMNYTTIRSVRNDARKQLAPPKARMIRHFCVPTFRRVIDAGVLTGQLHLKNYWQGQHHYWRGDWTPPGDESVDPLRESQANISDINACLRDPQRIIRARGEDPEKVLDSIQEWQRALKRRGLTTTDMVDALMGVSKGPGTRPGPAGALAPVGADPNNDEEDDEDAATL